jgi:hypothetical protein
MTKQVKILLRILAVFLFLFFFFFGANLWNGFCMGDSIMTGIGLSPWSEGTEGTHYPGIIALVGIAASAILFTSTTEQKARTSRRLVIGTVAALFLINLIYALAILI